jgi:hypothetical protein
MSSNDEPSGLTILAVVYTVFSILVGMVLWTVHLFDPFADPEAVRMAWFIWGFCGSIMLWFAEYIYSDTE